MCFNQSEKYDIWLSIIDQPCICILSRIEMTHWTNDPNVVQTGWVVQDDVKYRFLKTKNHGQERFLGGIDDQ